MREPGRASAGPETRFVRDRRAPAEAVSRPTRRALAESFGNPTQRAPGEAVRSPRRKAPGEPVRGTMRQASAEPADRSLLGASLLASSLRGICISLLWFTLAVVSLGAGSAVLPVQAQAQAVTPNSTTETNLRALTRLGITCLVDAPDTVAAFHLSAPDTMPYLRAALTDAWRERGRVVTLNDADATTPVLRYRVNHVSVGYAHAGRGAVERTVRLGLHYTLADAGGRILDEGVCSDSIADTVRARDLPTLHDPAYPETTAERPPAGWRRRIVEPVILVGSVAVAVLLFFSLRSEAGSQ